MILQKSNMSVRLRLVFLASIFLINACSGNSKLLHVTFHRGTANEIIAIAKYFNFNLTTWLICELSEKFLDDVTPYGNHLYNVDHGLAERVWEKHKDFFNSFDAVITSDTAPLARIFLQNNFQKPLIIWICNRFDYVDRASLKVHFPDEEYYQLLRNARQKKNVKIISYTAFEYVYAKAKKVDCGIEVIKPTGDAVSTQMSSTLRSTIPAVINKSETFFIPPYQNDQKFNVRTTCEDLGIKSYCGRYNGASDLIGFKGIIHLPYAWSNLALWENIQNGLIYFIPSFDFVQRLIKNNYFFNFLGKDTAIFSEWYDPKNVDLFVYFDSWRDLKEKITTLDFQAKRQRILKFARQHKKAMLDHWQNVFIQLGLM